MTPTDIAGIVQTEIPTPTLRFVDGKLEQLWINKLTGEEVWKRVEKFETKKEQRHG